MNAENPHEKVSLSAMEKAAWTEFLVALFTILFVLFSFPWLGNASTSGFAFLAFVPCGMWFFRGQRKQTHVDERDQDIDQKSRLIGLTITWMYLFLTLIATVLWNSNQGNHWISLGTLNWIVWTQFAIFFMAHGLATIISYRKQRYAS